MLVKHGEKDDLGELLNNAAGKGNLEVVQFILEEFKVNVNELHNYHTPLTSAISATSTSDEKLKEKLNQVIKYLIDEAKAPLHYTVEHLSPEIQEKYKDNGNRNFTEISLIF